MPPLAEPPYEDLRTVHALRNRRLLPPPRDQGQHVRGARRRGTREPERAPTPEGEGSAKVQPLRWREAIRSELEAQPERGSSRAGPTREEGAHGDHEPCDESRDGGTEGREAQLSRLTRHESGE